MIHLFQWKIQMPQSHGKNLPLPYQSWDGQKNELASFKHCLMDWQRREPGLLEKTSPVKSHVWSFDWWVPSRHHGFCHTKSWNQPYEDWVTTGVPRPRRALHIFTIVTNHTKTSITSHLTMVKTQLIYPWNHSLLTFINRTDKSRGGFHKWGYPQFSSISRWDFPS